MLNTKEELVSRLISIVKSRSDDTDIYDYIDIFKIMLIKYQGEEIAKLLFEISEKDDLLMGFLGIAGDKEAEIYLRMLIGTEINDDFLWCAGGLAGLNIDEGFEGLDRICKSPERSPDYTDVFDLLEFIDNSRANKMKQNMLDGEYGEEAKKYAQYYTDNPRY